MDGLFSSSSPGCRWTRSLRYGLAVGLSLVAVSSMYGCLGGSGGSSSAEAPVVVDKYSSVPTPTVKLVPTGTIGAAARDYPFFAWDMSLDKFGYVEEEFFFEGKANAYDTPSPSGVGNNLTTAGVTANVVTKDNPYKTRMVVYRPTDPAKFNGTTIVEWQNVSNGYDTPVQWIQQKDFALRKGYAWVEVSAQTVGLTNATTGLKVWSPTRYGTLDVTNGSTVTGDLLSYDIFAQAAKAIRSVPAVMGGLQSKKVIAIGNSQSAGRLGVYLNGIQSLHKIYDGAILVVGGPKMRTDLEIPIMKVLSESEIAGAMTNENPVLQADAANFVTWAVTGSSHSEIYGAAVRGTILKRDLNRAIGESTPAGSTQAWVPTRSRIPFRYATNSAIVAIEKFIENGTPLPKASPMLVTDANVPTVARDSYGNALGGLRLPDIDVPIALDNGYCVTGGPCDFSTVTKYIGTHVPFTKAVLDSLYPTHASYVNKYKTYAQTAVAQGFLLQDDANEAIAVAESSIIGEGLNCDGALCADISQFPKKPSILTLRMQFFVYNIANRSTLLTYIDDATRQIATGYLFSDPASARRYFQRAVASLNTYITLVKAEATTVKSISQATADYLVDQANTMITELNKL